MDKYVIEVVFSTNKKAYFLSDDFLDVIHTIVMVDGERRVGEIESITKIKLSKTIFDDDEE